MVLCTLGTLVWQTDQLRAQTWQRLATFDGYISFVKFLNDSIGFVGLGLSPGATLQQPPIQLYHTTDGGKTWKVVVTPSGYSGEIADIQMVDSVNGWLAMTVYGGQGNRALWRTTDAGLTWNETSLVGSGTSVGFTPNAMVVTDLFNQGHVSTDGGKTFSNAFLPSTNCAAFVDDLHGAVSDYRGDNWLYTSDGGLSWHPSNMTIEAWTVYPVKGTPDLYAAPEGPSTGSYYLTETGHVFESTDYGVHWSAVANFPFIFTGCLAGISDEWLVCQVHSSDTANDTVNHGGFYYSTDKGITWTGIGGPSALGDTRFSVIQGCSGVTIFGFDHFYQCSLYKYTFGSDGGGPGALSVPTQSQLVQTSCAPSDTAIPLEPSGCFTHAMLDSAWLTGSSAFTVSDARSLPRTLSGQDSILVSYGGSSGFDTAILHLQYTLGSGIRDTSILLTGRMAGVAQYAYLHREAASAYFGGTDTLPLQVDISGQINLDSLWPYLQNITGTLSFDSSVASFSSYTPPTGWTISSLTNRGNAVDFVIHKVVGSFHTPLDLGTAIFLSTSPQLATSWVLLPRFIMQAGGHNISLCVTQNEDSHWAVKDLGVQNDVAAAASHGGISIYPNPATEEIFVQNKSSNRADISIYDALGRKVAMVKVNGACTSTVSIASLARGSYLVVCKFGNQITTTALNIR